MSHHNPGVEPYNSMYEKGYVRGNQFPDDLPVDAPGRLDEEYMRGYEDGVADADLEEQEVLKQVLEGHILEPDPEDDFTVLGLCLHGVDLDREFCPQGCRV